MTVATEAPSLRMSSAAGRWVVAMTVLGSGIASLDATVVNIALPTIGRQFHAGVADLQWVITGYTLTLAAFLLIGGNLGTVSAGGGSSWPASPGSRSPPPPSRSATAPRVRRAAA